MVDASGFLAWERAYFLHNALEREARTYVGDRTQWRGRYEELWSCLEGRFGNQKLLREHTLDAFINVPVAEESDESVNSAYSSQIQAARRMLELNLGVESLLAEWILLKLPEEVREEVVASVPCMSRESQGDIRCNIVRRAVNETAGDRLNRPTQRESSRCTLALSAQTRPREAT